MSPMSYDGNNTRQLIALAETAKRLAAYDRFVLALGELNSELDEVESLLRAAYDPPEVENVTRIRTILYEVQHG